MLWGDFPVRRCYCANLQWCHHACGAPRLPSRYFPVAKIGQCNYLYVYEAYGHNVLWLVRRNKRHWCRSIIFNRRLTVSQAYNIDKKIDDGLPQSGSVTAV